MERSVIIQLLMADLFFYVSYEYPHGLKDDFIIMNSNCYSKQVIR